MKELKGNENMLISINRDDLFMKKKSVLLKQMFSKSISCRKQFSFYCVLQVCSRISDRKQIFCGLRCVELWCGLVWTLHLYWQKQKPTSCKYIVNESQRICLFKFSRLSCTSIGCLLILFWRYLSIYETACSLKQ